MFRSSNPALKEEIFKVEARLVQDTQPMTIQGTINKTFVLLVLVAISSAWIWSLVSQGQLGIAYPMMIAGAVVGLISGIVVLFKKTWVGLLAPVYAVAQGLFIGGMSSMLEQRFPGIAIQAVGLTFGTLFCLLGAYKTGWIRASDKFRAGLVSAMGGIMMLYFVSWIARLFGVSMSFMTGSGIFSIGLSVIVVAVAALNLVMDFDAIERGVKENAPKYMEWFGAFGLMVTLIWLYVEILILLSKLADRRNNA